MIDVIGAIGVSVGVVGVAIAIWSIKNLRLRKWKFTMLYFLEGILLFEIYQIFKIMDLMEALPYHELIDVGLNTGFILLIVVGIYKVRETAKTFGG